MSIFTTYPAIDLRQGQVVRFVQGDPARQTIYNDDPSAAARSWLEAGARWLHVVNLDGALEQPDQHNWLALQDILRQTARRPVRVQFGGGLRSLEILQRLFDLGADRAVLGTSALQKPELVEAALLRFGAPCIAIALDARAGKVSLRGWQQDSDLDPIAFGANLAARGVETLIYTNITRDGTGTGPDTKTARRIKDTAGCEVIVSGGVHSLEDIRQARQAGLDGVIVGRALYEGHFTLAEALRC